jgi:hypothetical protein
MVCFQTKNPNLGKFWRALGWKLFVYFMAPWNILLTFGIFNDHLAHFMFIWYIISGFGIMCQEKSGNPASTWGQDSGNFVANLSLRENLNADLFNELDMGVAQWTSQPPRERKTLVRIPPGYNVF